MFTIREKKNGPRRHTNRLAASWSGLRPRRLRHEPLENRHLLSGYSFADFSDVGGLTLVGDAAVSPDNRLRLTPAVGGMEGAAWYSAGKPVAALPFETTLQFQLTENFDLPGGSDGFVFIIQNTDPAFLSGGGGTLGYNALPNSLAVEFDTFQNAEAGDPSHSHISVHTNGTGANGWFESLSLGSYSTIPDLLDDAAVHTAKIAYTTGSLSIYLDDLTTPKLTVAVDLHRTLALDAGRAWVGFTATTGGGYQNHDILNWSFQGGDDLIIADNASVKEGAGGSTSPVAFTIHRVGSLAGQAVVNWTTADGTATAGADYVAASGQIVFDDGESEKTVEIIAIGDNADEGDETFDLVLSTTAGYATVSGRATIVNDDATVSVNDVTVIEGNTQGAFLGAFVSRAANGGLDLSSGLAFGPDGNLYVGSLNTDEVLRYDGTSGAFLGAFVSSGSGGLNGPGAGGLIFRPDGLLYVLSRATSSVLRYDAASGAFVDEFVAANSGGLLKPKGMTFGPDGALYVSSETDEVLRYDGTTGAFLGAFVSTGSGGLNNPRNLTFGPDGRLYVSSVDTDSVLRYDGATGAFVDAMVPSASGGLDGPADLLFSGGSLFVVSRDTDAVLRYDASSGSFIESYVPSGSGGLDRPVGLLLGSDGNLLVGSYAEILRYGAASQVAFTISLSATTSLPVTVNYATANGTALAGSDYTAVFGTVTFAPGETSKTVLVRTLDNTANEPIESFSIQLSAPVGAVIGDGQGIATIVDNDTKFFVVNDGSPDRTYEYASEGLAVENYSLNGANTAPRGAASTIAGDKVWVVDANKNVYVYNTSGGLLGSWTLGSLNSKATLQGIATNGTDVWVVDAYADKVYKYTGAASRLSGIQYAASSFSLNSGNKSPTDIVTDGTALWVVNSSSLDKVFKYTLAGGLAGSWTIDAANSTPTGVTVDPAGPSDVWIVDGGTDRVYQYTGAATRTSGSQAAASSFALASGNTNPQGIADPPVAAASDDPTAAVATLGSLPVPAVDLMLAARSDRRADVFTGLTTSPVIFEHSAAIPVAAGHPVGRSIRAIARQAAAESVPTRTTVRPAPSSWSGSVDSSIAELTSQDMKLDALLVDLISSRS